MQDVGDVFSGEGFRGCYPLVHIGEPPGEVDHKRFERQPAATGAVSEWLQAPPRQMWQRCHETVSEGWPPPADDESDGGLGHRNVAHLRQAGVHVVDDSSICRGIRSARRPAATSLTSAIVSPLVWVLILA